LICVTAAEKQGLAPLQPTAIISTIYSTIANGTLNYSIIKSLALQIAYEISHFYSILHTTSTKTQG
jgi:hypothetical protein